MALERPSGVFGQDPVSRTPPAAHPVGWGGGALMVSGGEEMRGADPVASSAVDPAASCRHLRAMNHGWAQRAHGWARGACPWIFFLPN